MTPLDLLGYPTAGMAFKSVPTLPLPKVPLTFIKEEVCLLLPLMSTSTWSGPRPCKEAGSMWSDPSEYVLNSYKRIMSQRLKNLPHSTKKLTWNMPLITVR